MTTLQPRPPYTSEELARLYPQDLELQQVQVILRHGERTPVNARFKNAGLAAYWPYCSAAKALRSAMLDSDGIWDTLTWTRKLESLGKDDIPKWNTGPKGQVDAICQPGELTDRGRETTLALGQRIRKLYVEQLGFLPKVLDPQTAVGVHIRATPIPRALESVQQAFNGLYPSETRSDGLPPPIIVTRAMSDETLFPNEGACKRFGELARAFADRTAQLYNGGPELTYINNKIGKYMPPDSPVVKVDSHPRLSGVMDSVNATLAHGKETRLPSEFYDKKVREYIDRICVEEWFVGYEQSNEYRKLGIGGLMGDLTQRMVEQATSWPAESSNGEPFKISLAGCHDTTIAASLAALGAFDIDKDKWPNFTSSVAFELFKKKEDHGSWYGPSGAIWPSGGKTWWSSLFSSPQPSQPASPRAPLAEWSDIERHKLDDYYVRLRYNDKPVMIPFCRPSGRHFKDDETFCTLSAFKEATDSFTPRNWKEECGMNLGKSPVGAGAGRIEKPPGL